MKKVILSLVSLVALVLFSGCSGRVTPTVAAEWSKLYDTTKTIYVKGKEIVVINSDLLDDDTLAILNKIDETAKRIDIVHNVVVDSEEINASMLIDLAVDSDLATRIEATKAVLEK